MDTRFIWDEYIYLNPKIFPANTEELLWVASSNDGLVLLEAQPLTDAVNMDIAGDILTPIKRSFASIDYIIAMESNIPFTNVEVEYIRRPFVVLRNLNPEMLYIFTESE